MPLRQILRSISHAINERATAFLTGSSYLRKYVPATPDNTSALDDMEAAAKGLQENA